MEKVKLHMKELIYSDKGVYKGYNETYKSSIDTINHTNKLQREMLFDLADKLDMFFVSDSGTEDYMLKDNRAQIIAYTLKGKYAPSDITEITKYYNYKCVDVSYLPDKSYYGLLLDAKDKFVYWDSFTIIELEKMDAIKEMDDITK